MKHRYTKVQNILSEYLRQAILFIYGNAYTFETLSTPVATRLIDVLSMFLTMCIAA